MEHAEDRDEGEAARSVEVEGAAPGKTLSDAARRALEEAALRRLQARAALPKEVNGARGPEPTRYGDWERKGRLSDF